MSLLKKMMVEADDPYHIGQESDSDDERGGKSSDEEPDAFECLQSGEQEHSGSSDSEDDFGKEMLVELDAVMLKNYKAEAVKESSTSEDPVIPADKGTEGKTATEEKPDLYDEEYFSSGSDDDDKVGGVASKSMERRKIMTNEDLFYDPNMDDEDEKWVSKQREINKEKSKSLSRKRDSGSGLGQSGSGISDTKSSTKQSRTQQQKVRKAPTSDAILSCPACMSTLCIDCQRHEIYKNQYRAMFVMNCNIISDEILKYQEEKHRHLGKKRKGKQKGKLVSQETAMDGVATGIEDTSCETYHPVKCAECGTEVAVYDSDEIYHFFNILTSYA